MRLQQSHKRLRTGDKPGTTSMPASGAGSPGRTTGRLSAGSLVAGSPTSRAQEDTFHLHSSEDDDLTNQMDPVTARQFEQNKLRIQQLRAQVQELTLQAEAKNSQQRPGS